MTFHYVDASAWVKCYYSEEGTDWMRALIKPAYTRRLACAALGYRIPVREEISTRAVALAREYKLRGAI